MLKIFLRGWTRYKDWKTYRKMERVFRRREDPYGYLSHPQERKKQDMALEWISDRRYKKALDIGCAEGTFTQRLAPFCDQILGVDISPTAIERARANCASLSNVRFQCLNIRDPSLAPGWDLIAISELLYYMEEPRWEFPDLIRTIADLLSSGGRLFLIHSFAGEHELKIRRGYVQEFLQIGLQLEKEKIGENPPPKPPYLLSLLQKPHGPSLLQKA